MAISRIRNNPLWSQRHLWPDVERLDLQPVPATAPDSLDVAPDQSTCYSSPSNKEECLESTCVNLQCDFFPVLFYVEAAQGGPLLSQVRVISGPCRDPSPCSPECKTVSVSPGISVVPDGGAWCELVAASTDGRSQEFSVAIVQNYGEPNGICCESSPGRGDWVDLDPSVHFNPGSVVVDFSRDGGIVDGGDAGNSGTSAGETP